MPPAQRPCGCTWEESLTAGIATTTVTESLPVSAPGLGQYCPLARFWVATHALRMLPLNFAPGSYGPGPLHSLGKVRVLNRRQSGLHKWGSCELKI